jgi:hypothetical protein
MFQVPGRGRQPNADVIKITLWLHNADHGEVKCYSRLDDGSMGREGLCPRKKGGGRAWRGVELRVYLHPLDRRNMSCPC